MVWFDVYYFFYFPATESLLSPFGGRLDSAFSGATFLAIESRSVSSRMSNLIQTWEDKKLGWRVVAVDIGLGRRKYRRIRTVSDVLGEGRHRRGYIYYTV